jgi:hypothetical protein
VRAQPHRHRHSRFERRDAAVLLHPGREPKPLPLPDQLPENDHARHAGLHAEYRAAII